MVERVRIERVRYDEPCSQHSWYFCLIAMNGSGEHVMIKREALDDVIRCHQERCGGHVSHDLIIYEGKTQTQVRRHQLYQLVQEHGEVCEQV